jgi:hypothetical protein
MKNSHKTSVLFLLPLFGTQLVFAQVTDEPQPRRGPAEIRTVDFNSLSMSDPYILPDPVTKMYYMTGSGGRMWISHDLKMWEGPYNVVEIDPNSWMGPRPMIWAAELHFYKGRYYYFATFTNRNIIVDKVPGRYDVQRRASHILMSETVTGPYKPMNDKIYLPENWSTLDGTLWVEDGVPYMIFCHEWMQIVDGTMDMIQLSDDLSESVGEPVTLFKASDGPWSREMNSISEVTFGMKLGGQVTDGPFLFKTQTGKLGMLWSSWSDQRYAQGVAYSASGKLKGRWIQEKEALNPKNSGHGMMFRTFEGKLLMSLHYQSLDRDNPGPRKPMLLEVDDSGDKIKITGRYNP